MRIANLIKTVSAASDITSAGFQLGDLQAYSIDVVISGADVVGTLSLEGSNDATGSTGWITITGSSTAVTLSSDVMYNASGAEYRWVRVFWDYTSGTGNITANITAKEVMVKNG